MKFFSILITFLALLSNSFGQLKIGLLLPPNESKITFPFKLVNNLVVIPVTINNQITLNFIMDTGANTAILTDRLFADIMSLHFDRSIHITGPGLIDSIEAHVANKVNFNLPGRVRGRNMSLLVLEQDYIELKKNLGEDIYGIIGYDIFNRFIVKIDYEKLELTLYDPDKFKSPRGYEEFDLYIERTKPFIITEIENGNKKERVKLMIDTGASHALLLDLTTSDVLTIPDTTVETSLGYGLGGEIIGRIGRYEYFKIGSNRLNNILVSIPDDGAYSNAIKRGSRQGTIGGLTLSRFNVIFDYPNSKLYLQKNNSFRIPFEYDMSGLRISYFENPGRLEISGIMKNSPAAEANLEVGDVLENINGMNINNTKLSSIYYLLRSKNGKKINLKIRRNDEIIDVDFRLRRMI